MPPGIVIMIIRRILILVIRIVLTVLVLVEKIKSNNYNNSYNYSTNNCNTNTTHNNNNNKEIAKLATMLYSETSGFFSAASSSRTMLAISATHFHLIYCFGFKSLDTRVTLGFVDGRPRL